MKFEILPVTHYQQNCSLIWCEVTEKAALVDPGGEAERLLKEVEQRRLVLEKVLLTHGHLDHVGAAHTIAQQAGVPLVGPAEEDRFWFEWLPKQSELFGFPHHDAFYPDQWLSEGDEVYVGEQCFEIFACPGHTPGHIVFYHRDSQTVFVGDVLFQGSVGRSDFPGGDHGTLIQSIRDKLLVLDDEVVVVPGHGPKTTIGRERRSNPYLV